MMEDDFGYNEYIENLKKLDEIEEVYEAMIEEEIVRSWTLVLRDSRFAIFADYKGETRIINVNYIDSLFSN